MAVNVADWTELSDAVIGRENDIVLTTNITVTDTDAPIDIGADAATAITIRSQAGNYTITGTGIEDANYNAFNITDNNAVTFQNVTLTGFKSTTPTINVTGTGAELNLTSATISNSTGIYMGTGTTLNALKTKFTNLTASMDADADYYCRGGAIYGDGATINIGDGTDTNACTFKSCKAIYQEDPDDETTAIGEGGSIYINGGSLTINNSSATDGVSNCANDGGFLYAAGTAKVSLTQLQLSDFMAYSNGGAIYLCNSDDNLGENEYDATIVKCDIDNCIVELDGAGVYIVSNRDSHNLVAPKVLMQGTSFNVCKAAGGNGGAIYNGGRLYVTNYVELVNGVKDNTENYVFDCEADSGGGGIYNQGFLQIEASRFYNNRPTSGGAENGGAIYNTGQLKIYNSVICNNIENIVQGGGIYSDYTGDPDIPYEFFMINCTVAGNVGSDVGAGIAFSDPNSERDHIYNSLIVNNTIGVGSEYSNISDTDNIDIQYSIYEDVEKKLFETKEDGSLKEDDQGRPIYQLYPTADNVGDALNKGSNELYAANITGTLSPGDFKNDKRFQVAGDASVLASGYYQDSMTITNYDANVVLDAYVDMGAYEYVGVPLIKDLSLSSDYYDLDTNGNINVTTLDGLKQAIVDVKYNYIVDSIVNGIENPTVPKIIISDDLTTLTETLNFDSLIIADDETFSGEGERAAVPLVLEFSGQEMTMDSENASRIFRINAAAPDYTAPITISNVTLSGDDGNDDNVANDTPNPNNGGALFIEKDAELVLNNVAFVGNKAKNGGAINNYGTLTMNGGEFTSNVADRFGGAYFGCGNATFNGVTFSSNTALTGGAIYSQNRTGYGTNDVATIILDKLVDENSETPFYFVSNTATGTDSSAGLGNGGAIANFGTMTINGSGSVDSTDFYLNSANFLGGAIINGTGAVLDLNNAFFSANTVGQDGILGYGGAISNAGSLTITSGSFDGNTATQNGGALSNTGTLVFDGTTDDLATSFTNNTAKDFGGAVVSTSSLSDDSFTAINKPTFGTELGSNANVLTGDLLHQACGIDFANGYSTFVVTASTHLAEGARIYNYNFSVQAGGALVSLKRLAMANSGKVMADFDGDNVLEEIDWISPSELGMNVGKNQLDIALVDEMGNITKSSVVLNVIAADPNISATMLPSANGQFLRLALDIAAAAPIQTWKIHWGDGKSSVYSSAAEVQNAVHYYAAQSQTAVYDVQLELTEIGANNSSVYFIGTHEVSAAVAESTLSTELANSSKLTDSSEFADSSEFSGTLVFESSLPKMLLETATSKTVSLKTSLSEMGLPLTTAPLTVQFPFDLGNTRRINAPVTVPDAALISVFENYSEEVENNKLDFLFDEIFRDSTENNELVNRDASLNDLYDFDIFDE